MSLRDDVYGITYKAAADKMLILARDLSARVGVGFETTEELEQWAHEHLLDKLVFMQMNHKFFCLSHKGEIITPSVFSSYYENILFVLKKTGSRTEQVAWTPSGYKYCSEAYIIAEQSDGLHKPVYFRDYTLPTGYYSEERDAFNVAKPFPVFAKETGRDTSHVYTYIQHVAGECAMWLLAWLRAKMLYPTLKTQIVPIIVSRAQGSGKGQPLTSKVFTPSGFRAIGDLKDGDLVVSPADGKAYPVSIHNRGIRHVNKVTMSTGAVTWCDDLHIWQARTVSEQSRHKDFHEMPMSRIKNMPLKKWYRAKKGGYFVKQIYIPHTAPVRGDKKLPMAYAIGLFIGDGTCSRSSVYINEDDVYKRCLSSLAEGGYTLTQGRKFREGHYNVTMLTGTRIRFSRFLETIGVHGRAENKRLPRGFLQLDYPSRKALFEGLVDSDGYMSNSNNIDWTTASEGLYADMYDLASSIGLVVRRAKSKDTPKYTYNGERRTGQKAHRLFMKANGSLELSANHRSRMRPVQHEGIIAIKSIENAGDMECACIYVDSPDHLYITDDWIVTHNTTFAEVICKGLFGKDNVLVTNQYDSGARFNADYADALIVCQEEKEEEDCRNPAGALKSRATATTIRKERKGIDPIYQESHTDFILTTNKDVPIKFEGREDQRRFMIMEADEHFTRKESALADEVFTKLYGFDANFNKAGVPFVEDKDLIAQFKHELFTRQDIADVPLRKFPKTGAYERCFSLPRTTEATEIEAILRALAPFIHETLLKEHVVMELADGSKLSDLVENTNAIQFMPAYKTFGKFVAVCRPVVFTDGAGKAYAHSTVERSLFECNQWLMRETGITIMPSMEPLPGGFPNVIGRYRMAPAARFCLAEQSMSARPSLYKAVSPIRKDVVHRAGERLRVNKWLKPDDGGCFETVNEMRIGVSDIKTEQKRVQYMDTFLLRAEETSQLNKSLEQQRAEEFTAEYGSAEIAAETLYRERLSLTEKEAVNLFDKGIACRIVYSGAKSYHLLVRVKDSPKTLDEYKWLHNYLCDTLSDKMTFDKSKSEPTALTRSPVTQRRLSTDYGLVVEGEQRLVAEDWSHVYDIDWRKIYDE